VCEIQHKSGVILLHALDQQVGLKSLLTCKVNFHVNLETTQQKASFSSLSCSTCNFLQAALNVLIFLLQCGYTGVTLMWQLSSH